MTLRCPQCHIGLEQRIDESVEDITEVMINKSQIYTCPSCETQYPVWSEKDLAIKIVISIFCLWFCLICFSSGLFALSIWLGLPDYFGYTFVTEISGTILLTASFIGIVGGVLAFYAYPVDVIRQIWLRFKLR